MPQKDATGGGGAMTLDLDELTSGWDCPPGELRARAITGRDGEELLQLRIDLGVMQMLPAGRPDGTRYCGLPSAAEFVRHELRLGRELGSADWDELERELTQTNYRRMAYAGLAEAAMSQGDEPQARRFLSGALADIQACLAMLKLLRKCGARGERFHALLPTLVFDRARVAAQLQVIEEHFEDAIDHAELGAAKLDELLAELGYDEEQRAADPGLRYLRALASELRTEYGITQTLAEQLAEAIANDDFETAARLRDELERRQAHLRLD
jgi:hypothetical protein